MMEVAPVAGAAVCALLKGKAEIVTGFIDKVMAFSARPENSLTPRRLSRKYRWR